MELEITFFIQKDDDNKYLVHSTLSILNGYGDTEEEAIKNHLWIFNKTQGLSESYKERMRLNPKITIENYILTSKQ